YMLWMFQRVMYGPLDKPENQALPDWTSGEKWALAPLVLLIFGIGLYPTPLLERLNPSVNTVLTQAAPLPDRPFDMPQTGTTAKTLTAPPVVYALVPPKGSRP
ncbi:MAG: hypothetical protein M3Y13_15595, partial [Armatimonadota bacterium]|nr:hypothetical protein [Armatimonadota bacterium]